MDTPAIFNDTAPILLVEDDFLIRVALAGYLRQGGGLDVLEAGCADEAMDAIADTPVLAMLLTDMRIPGALNGAGLAAVARGKWPGLPVLYLSGDAPPPAGSTGGVDRDSYIPKPFEPSLVLKRIQAILGRNPTMDRAPGP